MYFNDRLITPLAAYIKEKFEVPVDEDPASRCLLRSLVLEELEKDPTKILEFISENLYPDMVCNEMKKVIMDRMQFLERKIDLLDVELAIQSLRLQMISEQFSNKA